MKWKETFYIPGQDEDMNCLVGAGTMMRLMHECAEWQVDKMGPSNESLRKEGKAFLVSRFTMDIPRPLHGLRQAEVFTWGCPCRGFSFIRCYELRQDDQTVARAKATMALVNIQTRHLLRTDDYHPGFATLPEEPPQMSERFRLPPTEEMTPAGTHTVRYADCDLNGHLNNTRYADMFCGMTDMRGKRVTGLSVSYRQEAPLGTLLSVYSAQDAEGRWLFRSLLPDGTVNAEAAMTLSDI